ncbi:hypothetical protein BHYA_0084g00240 [Botrytis hyacinthi]|uniref:Uncharacterized protein n=1 Tax=Botrytis hyacinthi TaxID=278943 RepID=A0A4Z1GXI4_9HELO|nr:hypothetical protein BHYA_0084g00240 [Botrytis hyacinthi]
MGVISKRSYEYNYKILHRELPRFVPPIKLKFVESESEIRIDFGLVQSVLDMKIEEDSGVYMLVGICEGVDIDMDMTEVEEMEERKGIGEGVKVCARCSSASGLKDGAYEILGARCGYEGDEGGDGGVEGGER